MIIATLNRLHGSTGVHTHTAALHAGLTAAGVTCDVVTAFDGSPAWLGLFAFRKVLDRVKPDAAVAWYRTWHGAALKASLSRVIGSRLAVAPKGRLSDGCPSGATAKRKMYVIAQDPVSARVALDLRDGLNLDYPISLVCHFNHSEAREYRELGQLVDPAAYDAMLAFEAEVLRSVDRVIYVSDWARGVVEDERHLTPRESVVIHNGISATIDAPPLTRASLGLAADDVVLMNVGTLEARKNQLGLLELFGIVAQAKPQARLVLVGDGADRAAIESRVGELGLRDRVTLLGHRRDVPSLLPLANVYVHYASAENCPIVVLEAARVGLPWAAVSTAGIVELQRLLGGAVKLDPDNVPASARKLLEVIDDPVLARHLGQTARTNFRARFTREAMVNAYLAALKVGAPA